MKILKQNREAFSLLELVFVIVILGIVSSIGAQIIAQVYESYVIQRASHRSSIKTELAANIIANRLAYSIPGTVIGRKDSGAYDSIDNTKNSDYNVLQWVGYDADSFGSMISDGNRNPGWSGLADLNATTVNSVSTPGSNIDFADTIIKNLGLTGGVSSSIALFQGQYNVRNLGYDGDSSGTVLITGGSDESFSVDLTGRTISEHYKLAWSSYAITAEADGKGNYNLFLKYNFQPWNGSNIKDAPKVLLLHNVSVFRFTGSPNAIRFKICQQEGIGGAFKVTTCKEKAVIR